MPSSGIGTNSGSQKVLVTFSTLFWVLRSFFSSRLRKWVRTESSGFSERFPRSCLLPHSTRFQNTGKICVGLRLDWRFGWVCVTFSWGNRFSGHHWYFVGKISFLILLTCNQKACSATISLTQYSLWPWIKKQKSFQRTKREDVSLILDNLLPEAHRTESRKPQYLDREELHWRPEVQLTLRPEEDLGGMRGRDLLHEHAVLIGAALGLEPRPPTSFYLSAQPELTQSIHSARYLLGLCLFSPGPNESCVRASTLLYGLCSCLPNQARFTHLFNTISAISK